MHPCSQKSSPGGDPLPELRTVLRTFEPKLFARAYLAASATRGADRETAIELLLEQVRFGRPDQAQVAMAALRAITGGSWPSRRVGSVRRSTVTCARWVSVLSSDSSATWT